MRALRRLSIALVLGVAALRGHAQEAWPKDLPRQLSQPVNDLAGMLSDASASRLDQVLRQVNADGQGPQVVVVTLPSIGDRAIEDVGIQVSRGWGIGDKVRKDGVLLLIAKQERKIRIEVGTKFEGDLPDVTCKRIIEEIMVPAMRGGNSDGAIESGVASILDIVAPGATQGMAPQPAEGNSDGFPWLFVIILVVGVILNLGMRAAGFGGRGGWGGGMGGFGGGGFGGGGFGGGGGGGFSGGGGGFSGGGSSGGW
jgi:uncharacterized protein